MSAAFPNVLTAARLVAVPIVVALVLIDAGDDSGLRWWAVAVFVAAAITDFFDGFLARRWKTVSDFGKLADPIADKALVLSALIVLAMVDTVPWWPVIVLAVREVAVTWGRLAVVSSTVVEASWGGKVKTTLQLAAVTFFLVPQPPAWLDVTAWWCLIGAVIVAVITGVDYARRIWSVRREGESEAS